MPRPVSNWMVIGTMVDLTQHLLVGIACVIIPVSLLMWLLTLDRLWRGQPVLDWVPRRPVPWSLVDLLIVGLVGFAVLALSQWMCLLWFDLPAGGWELSDLKPEQQVGVLLTFSLSSLFTLCVAIGICRWRLHATASDLGIVPSMWQRDVILGVGAFVMLVVPVLLIHFVAQWLLPSEQGHPFIDLIMDDPRFDYLLPIALAALVAAPLVEEFFFRVMLQGWLEKMGAAKVPEVEPCETLDNDVVEPLSDPFPTLTPATPEIDTGKGWRFTAILISSLAFALAHFGQGPAPISLFFLALGLGYLYQRTHRVLPGIVVHFLINLTAVLQLILAIAQHQV